MMHRSANDCSRCIFAVFFWNVYSQMVVAAENFIFVTTDTIDIVVILTVGVTVQRDQLATDILVAPRDLL